MPVTATRPAAKPRSAALTVRRLPKAVVKRLKARAASSHRSLEAEVREILIAESQRLTTVEWLAEAERLRTEIAPWKPGMPTAAELVRQGRDEER